MPDETPLDMEKIGEVDDPAVLEAEIKRRAGTPAEPEKPVAPVEVVVDPEKPAEAVAVEVKPEEKPAAEIKPVETKPAETKLVEEAPKPRDDAAWKRVRLLEKENKELREAQAKPKTDEIAKLPAFEDDPAEFLKADLEQTKAQVERLTAEKRQTDQLNSIRSQESDFERAHPDYRQALTYLESDEIKDWEQSGVAQVGVQRLTQFVAAGRRGDRAYKPYADHVDNIAAQPAVQELATKENRDPEDVAIWLSARDTYLTERRQLVWQGAEATGKNPAEIAYTLAQRRGYKPVIATTEPAKPVAETADAARARVLAQKDITEATNSLSNSSTADAGPQPRVLRNRNEVLGLGDDYLDELIKHPELYRNLPER